MRYVDPTSLRQGTFQAVDGGENRVCRGASASDNSESYFEVAQGAPKSPLEGHRRFYVKVGHG